MKLFLSVLFFSILPYAKQVCQPTCDWVCEEIVCNASCEVNGCDVQCVKPALIICPEPKCELKCELPSCIAQQ